MRNIPGWVLGALGVTAIVGATYAGSRIGASAASAAPVPASAIAATAPAIAPLGELAVECEPGQRAVVSMNGTAAAPRVSCVSDPKPVGGLARTSYLPADASFASPVVYADEAPARRQARRAAIVDPVEVYRPRSVAVSSPTRYEVEPRRSVKKSVAIIAGSTAAGAVVGGLTKGKKGAVIGGLIGGGAATVWDQVTRRRDDR
jgi:hypothetical protein